MKYKSKPKNERLKMSTRHVRKSSSCMTKKNFAAKSKVLRVCECGSSHVRHQSNRSRNNTHSHALKSFIGFLTSRFRKFIIVLSICVFCHSIFVMPCLPPLKSYSHFDGPPVHALSLSRYYCCVCFFVNKSVQILPRTITKLSC